MNLSKKILIIITFGLCLGHCAFSQDIHFSQFFETPMLRNPSLSGLYSGDIRVQGVYRNQWNSVTNPYQTGSVNGEYKMPVGKGDDYVTTGLELFYDKAGSIGWTSTYVLPALNYHKSLSSDKVSYLSLGFMGGFVQKRFDRSKIKTNSTYDGLGDGETFTQSQFSYLDGSVGMSYNTILNGNPKNNFYLGAAYHHFNRPNNSFYRNSKIELNPKWVFSAGLKLSVADYNEVMLLADYSKQGTFKETVAGALYGIQIGDDPEKPDYMIHGGVLFRWNDAMIPVIKLDYSHYSVGLSYDVNISKLKPSSYGHGGFELSITYLGLLNKDRSFENSYLSPRF